MNHARIAGLGQWFPERVRSNSDWPEEFSRSAQAKEGDRTLVDLDLAAEADPFRAIAARYLREEFADPFLGGRERRIADPDVTSSDAEARAAMAALDDASTHASDVDAILSWSMTPDRITPSNACRVANIIGARRAWTTTIDSACASCVTQLDLAASLIESGRARTVLLTQSHLASRVFPLTHPASPCVGDGASAMVIALTREPSIRRAHAITHGEFHDAVMWVRGRTPETDPPWWEAGGPHFLGGRDRAATKDLMRNTVEFGVRTVRELAEREQFDVRDIGVLASVQPRRFIPLAIAEGLDIPTSRAPQTYERYAHLGGAGPIANLIAARESGLLRNGTLAVMYAQGAGFTRAAIAFGWNDR